VCPEECVEFSNPAGKFFILCYSILNPHQFPINIHYNKDNNEETERRQTN